MQNMVPVVVEERNTGFIGVLVILLFIFIIYTIASIRLSDVRYKKLMYAKQLIEKGHEKKILDQTFAEKKNKSGQKEEKNACAKRKLSI